MAEISAATAEAVVWGFESLLSAVASFCWVVGQFQIDPLPFVGYGASMDKLDLTPNPRLEPAPEKTAFDYGLAVARVASIAFPFVGAGVTLVDLVTAPLRGKRLTDWCEELRLRLNDLSQEVAGLSPESLAASDAFISAFAQATQAALRTHQQEKLTALRNAVVNVALGHEPDTDSSTAVSGPRGSILSDAFGIAAFL